MDSIVTALDALIAIPSASARRSQLPAAANLILAHAASIGNEITALFESRMPAGDQKARGAAIFELLLVMFSNHSNASGAAAFKPLIEARLYRFVTRAVSSDSSSEHVHFIRKALEQWSASNTFAVNPLRNSLKHTDEQLRVVLAAEAAAAEQPDESESESESRASRRRAKEERAAKKAVSGVQVAAEEAAVRFMEEQRRDQKRKREEFDLRTVVDSNAQCSHFLSLVQAAPALPQASLQSLWNLNSFDPYPMLHTLPFRQLRGDIGPLCWHDLHASNAASSSDVSHCRQFGLYFRDRIVLLHQQMMSLTSAVPVEAEVLNDLETLASVVASLAKFSRLYPLTLPVQRFLVPFTCLSAAHPMSVLIRFAAEKAWHVLNIAAPTVDDAGAVKLDLEAALNALKAGNAGTLFDIMAALVLVERAPREQIVSKPKAEPPTQNSGLSSSGRQGSNRSNKSDGRRHSPPSSSRSQFKASAPAPQPARSDSETAQVLSRARRRSPTRSRSRSASPHGRSRHHPSQRHHRSRSRSRSRSPVRSRRRDDRR